MEVIDKIRGSFLHGHMVESLKSTPSWTVQMYCVYNDLDEDTTKALVVLWAEEQWKKRKLRLRRRAS